MDEVVGIALAGGQGMRARPLTLEGSGYLRSKATLCFAGRALVEWQVLALQDQGVDSFIVVANGRENRYQIRDVLGYGENFGARVRYSRSRTDRHNTGSGEATLSNIEHFDVRGLALVFPTDSLFEFDLGKLVREHRASGAVVSVTTVDRPASNVVDKYGTMVTDGAGWITRFVEKPSAATLREMAPDPSRVPINAGMYLIDCGRLRALARAPEIAAMARDQLDWGNDLLPWLVAGGHPVRRAPITKVGDLGNPRDFLVTLADALAGGYPHLLKRMEPPAADNVWIHESSLRQRDPATGMTLAAKLSAGLVRVGPNVLIGRDVEIGPGVVISNAYIGDGVDLHPRCRLHRVACLDGAVVGPAAQVTDTHIGVMAQVESTMDTSTVLSGFTALGAEVTVRAGARLSGVSVYPGLTVPPAAGIASGTTLTTQADLLAWT